MKNKSNAAEPAGGEAVPAGLSDAEIRTIYVRYWGLDEEEFCVAFARAIIDTALAASAPGAKRN